MRPTTTARWRLPLATVNHESAPWAYRLLLRLLQPIMTLLTRRRWLGGEHVPTTGGVVVVSNHLSNYDTLAIGEYLIYHGRWPRYMGKEEIWRVPVIRWFADQCRQIPVRRNTPRAKDALVHAAQALRAGDVVALYPEGTITQDPDGWPMTGRRGAVVLALETGAPMIPIAVWGTDHVLGRQKLKFPRVWKRRPTVAVQTGPAIDLSPWHTDSEPTPQQLDAAAAHMMDVLTTMVAELRGDAAPHSRWDMRVGERI